MPARIASHEGSALIAQSRVGMVATIIQSTAGSRPMRAAESWLTTVEKVLLSRPSWAAAIQFDFGAGTADSIVFLQHRRTQAVKGMLVPGSSGEGVHERTLITWTSNTSIRSPRRPVRAALTGH